MGRRNTNFQQRQAFFVVCKHKTTQLQRQSKHFNIMLKLFCTSIIILSTISAFGQSTLEALHQNISADSGVVYRLFATRNMYTFIKLNTRNGQMRQVQWGTESQYR